MNTPVNRFSESPLPSEKKPKFIKPLTKPETKKDENLENLDSPKQPIPPPSNPKQYRAIGLIRGTYRASDEQLTRGALLTSDGTAIDAVLLGRVLSLVKNHLDLDKEHLWVVYPRTRQENDLLHVQIVGVWEPETLSQSDSTSEESALPEINSSIESGYFSIRGEVIYFSIENEVIIVKIKQAPKKESETMKFFKLKLKGVLSEKPLRHFWDLHAQLQGETLVIQEANDLGFATPKKKPFPKKGDRHYPTKPIGRKSPSDSRPSLPVKKSEASKPMPKPMPKPKQK